MHLTLLTLLVLVLTISSATAATVPASKPSNKHKPTPKKANGKKSSDDKPQHPKYFHEAGGSLELGHYDSRYFKQVVPYEEHRPALHHLVRSWLTTTRELGIETWLAHGTLLGWWWSGRVMPWDYDIDVQMPTTTLAYLGRYFNRTLHDYQFLAEESSATRSAAGNGGGGGGLNREMYDTYVNKTYLLDINPHHADVGRGNGHNVIDGRWIDTSNGLFIDITGLMERDPAANPGVWSCKNAHRYRTRELYPVRRTEFEGVPASIPYSFDKILTDEYGAKSLVNTEWAGHRWIPELKEWVKIPEPPPSEEEAKISKQSQDSKAVVVVVEKTVVKGSRSNSTAT
ncbi:hypothetical protein M426DRAFT_263120 [Hypoxylon sp. CI-4A]|nr:hypothetical protein M426DRAFT_263120 [Hypoxylon sp. CI-4A]